MSILVSYKPFVTYTLHSIPTTWREAVKKWVTQDYITSVGDEATPWSSCRLITPQQTGHPNNTPQSNATKCHPVPDIFPPMTAWQATGRFLSMKYLTTATTQWGRYNILRNPMGFGSPGPVVGAAEPSQGSTMWKSGRSGIMMLIQ